MYQNSKNEATFISNDVLVALIQASDAYLEEPTYHNWCTFQELSDSILKAEMSFDDKYFQKDE